MATVLIVEDEWLIAEDFAFVLRNAGHEVVGPCNSVKAALSTLETTAVDAAFLDVELRDERSFPVAERLMQQDIPFTFLSGHGSRELPPAMNGVRLLPKPVDHPALLVAVKKMCPGE